MNNYMISIERQKELIQEVLNNLDDIAVPYEPINWKLGTFESVSTYGRCWSADSNGVHDIEINKHIKSEKIFKQVVAHEIIHTIDGCDNHDRSMKNKGFHYWGDLVNRELADCEYNIDTHVTELDIGVKEYEESVSNWKMVSPMDDKYTWYAKSKTQKVKKALLGTEFMDTCKDIPHTYSVYHKCKTTGSWNLVRLANELEA